MSWFIKNPTNQTVVVRSHASYAYLSLQPGKVCSVGKKLDFAQREYYEKYGLVVSQSDNEIKVNIPTEEKSATDSSAVKETNQVTTGTVVSDQTQTDEKTLVNQGSGESGHTADTARVEESTVVSETNDDPPLSDADLRALEYETLKNYGYAKGVPGNVRSTETFINRLMAMNLKRSDLESFLRGVDSSV